MRFATAIALTAAIPALVSAQAEHAVKVGAGGLTFDPPVTTAAQGDKVVFTFEAKNHSVTQAAFTSPCIKSADGFTSGFQAVDAASATKPTFTITINNTNPIWFYCGQKIPANHCQAGMVGAINPTADKTIDAFKAAAMGGGSPSAAPSGASSAAPAASSAAPGASAAVPSSAASGGAAAPPAPTTKPSGAMRITGAGAGLLTLLGLLAGVTL